MLLAIVILSATIKILEFLQPLRRIKNLLLLELLRISCIREHWSIVTWRGLRHRDARPYSIINR